MKFLQTFVLALLLAACTQGYSQNLNPSASQSFRLVGIDVSVAPGAHVYWGDGEANYAASIGGPPQDAGALGMTPAGQAYVGAMAAKRIKAAFKRAFVGRLESGERPVRIAVLVKRIFISSAIQRILIGGDYEMNAGVNLVDANTGNVLASNPDLATNLAAGNGIAGVMVDPLFGEPLDRLADNLAASYRNWLLPNGGAN